METPAPSPAPTPGLPRETTTYSGPDELSCAGDTLELLKVAQSLRDYHHKALWEEQKHFTWLISILLAGVLVVAGAQGLGNREKLALLTVLAALGAGISFLAIRVLRREGRNFQYALQRFVPLHNRLFCEAAMPSVVLPGQCETTFQLLAAVWRGSLNVRDSFQLIILSFQAAFALVGGLSGFCLARVLLAEATCLLSPN